MKTIAVICEFNPLHKGHEYFLREVRERSGADFIVAVMSGDFVQRGEPALFDKYIRTEAALRCGCDLVLELPAGCSCGSARNFAEGAMSLIASLKVIDEIWFGSESGNIEDFRTAARILSHEPVSFKEALKYCQKQGFAYPKARALALEKVFSTDGSKTDSVLSDTAKKTDACISSPNNILGTEYCLAAARLFGNALKMHTIKRSGAGYEDNTYIGELSSAGAIRNKYKTDGFISVTESFPDSCRDLFKAVKGGVYADDLSSVLKYRIITSSADDLAVYNDVSADLARRIKNNENSFTSFTDFTLKIKSKNYTYTHISRALISVILGIKQYDSPLLHPFGQVRMLGMRSCLPLLGSIRENGGAKILSQPGEITEKQYEASFTASALYQGIYGIKYHTPSVSEYSRRLIKL